MAAHFPDWHRQERTRTRWAGLVLGVALSMLFDGIVLHQLLQWHHVVSHVAPIPGMENLEPRTFFDGVFHAFAYVVLVVGILLLWHLARVAEPMRVGRMLFGFVLIGFGGFNMVESIVNHWILQLHHVRDGVESWWIYDGLFFLFGGALIAAIGWLIVRSVRFPLR
jgi:uncharacterized membrane protein